LETELCLHSETIDQNSKQSLDSALAEVWHKKEIGNIKRVMRRNVLIIAACLLFTPIHHAQAIEGLKISLQCSNVVLSWPCLNDGSETFIVQQRQTLDPSTPWQMLTSSLTADYGTNMAYFVHSNAVQHPNCGGSFAPMAASRTGETFVKKLNFFDWGVPLATRADGTGSIVPLALYPPGVDLSDFLIFDPAVSDWLKGSEFSREALTLSKGVETMDGPLDPEGGGSGDGGTSAPETGFYRVVRNGVHLVGITNGMAFSGVVSIPVEVGTDSGNLASLSVSEDGAAVGNSASIAPFQLPLHVVLDTTAMSNGVHQITGNASWSLGTTNEGGDGVVEAESPVITVNVDNEITFPNWIEHFGELYDSVLLTAESSHPDADWYIDIYGSESGYIGTFGGHTFDGQIYASWNLVGPPPNFTVYNNERYFDFVVTTEWAGTLAAQGNGPQPQDAGGTASAIKRTYKQTDNWTSKGMWVVANQQAWESSNGSEMLDIATDGFVQAAEINSLTVRPSHPYDEAFRIGFGEGIPESTRNAQWQALRDAIFHQESRNLFYLGHGGDPQIGYSANTNRMIPASEIAARLHTIPAGQTNRHGYRFVFLYGCSTAGGTLPESFGIIHKENVKGIDYVNAALTPAAFVGWNNAAAAGVAGNVLTDNVNYLQHFQSKWAAEGLGVREALRQAKENYSDVGFINFNKLKVFGNWELSYWAFNR
jgi:hypothetical protein